MVQAALTTLSGTEFFSSLTPNQPSARCKTQIVCTIGPASCSPEMLSQLVSAGMSIARLNMSYGTREWHQKVINNLRTHLKATGEVCAILVDLQSNSVLTGLMPAGGVTLKRGDHFNFLCAEAAELVGDETQVTINYQQLPSVVRQGSEVVIDNTIVLTVVRSSHTTVTCEIKHGGVLASGKRVHVPNTKLDLRMVTDKDLSDVLWAAGNRVDFISCFARKAEHVAEIFSVPEVAQNGVKVIAKVDSQASLDAFTAIADAADGIFIARGDLGVNLPIKSITSAQKRIISSCNAMGKPVITAAQMLDSLVTNPSPTRAEATDVANAVFDGSDCVMLSSETAIGAYPVQAVNVMRSICVAAERRIDYRLLFLNARATSTPPTPVAETVSSSSVKTAWDIEAALVMALTVSGTTVRYLAKYRPSQAILCVTASERTASQCLLSRGAVPCLMDNLEGDVPSLFARAVEIAKGKGLVKSGQPVVLVIGSNVSGSDNLMQVVVAP